MDTPETDAVLAQYAHHLPNWLVTDIMWELAKRLERERNEWKANHDKMVEEKQQAELLNVAFHMRIRKLESAIRNLRDVKGRHHSEMAYNKLVAMLPESKGTEL